MIGRVCIAHGRRTGRGLYSGSISDEPLSQWILSWRMARRYKLRQPTSSGVRPDLPAGALDRLTSWGIAAEGI